MISLGSTVSSEDVCELCLCAAGGISGIVVGLSAQAVLGNIVSGLNLYISRPFVAGEPFFSGSHILHGRGRERSQQATHALKQQAFFFLVAKHTSISMHNITCRYTTWYCTLEHKSLEYS